MRVDNQKPSTLPSTDLITGILHDIHILDSSGSMDGSKYNNAIEGINKDITNAKKQAIDFPNIISTMSVVEFSGSGERKYHQWMIPVEKSTIIYKNIIGGSTALYETLGEVIEKMLIAKRGDDKVLIKVLTDGGENESKGKYTRQNNNNSSCPALAQLIDKVQKENGFTITFVGTKEDTDIIIRNLHIDSSNTLVHENTGISIEKSYDKTVNARVSFMQSYSKGEDVSRGFYTKTVN